ncbi:uncharacterized protein CIMG_10642 [Coccidioides immitis RS]|uniref:Uncharacterized protein n=1 Tax=Coccidioides immitis (strain RS) TaxID=246410 RepID=J3KI17_COCIM|nr:uncharacterized protein CIMG_10642 [Coccidioides immitis RS]EAS35561.3 hypothetical protein CIMG_10642 [Coccidioides immitis RS]
MSNGRDEGCGEATRKGERLGPKFRVSVGYDTGYLYSVLVHVYACVCERQTNGEKLPSRREKEDSQFDYSVCKSLSVGGQDIQCPSFWEHQSSVRCDFVSNLRGSASRRPTHPPPSWPSAGSKVKNKK